MKYIIAALILQSLLFANQANGQSTIYKTVHADGSVSYSDTPSPGAIEVTIGGAATVIPSTPVQTNTNIQANIKQKQYKLAILSPEPEATIRNNTGTFNIQAELSPKIGGLFTIDINGQSIQSPNGVFKFENMDRGEYTYKVSFTDNTGKIIASSEQRKLFLHKASVLIPRN